MLILNLFIPVLWEVWKSSMYKILNSELPHLTERYYLLMC